jgi:signal transduction histidine kinase
MSFVPTARILRTATFRMALAYLALFGSSVFVLLGFVYVVTTSVIEQQTTQLLDAEVTALAEQHRLHGLVGLHRAIQRRTGAKPHATGIYLLTDPLGRPLAGNIETWPAAARDENGFLHLSIAIRTGEDEVDLRTALARTFVVDGGYRLLVGRDIEDRLRIQQLIERTMLWGIGLTLLLGLAGGLAMSRPLLRRIDAINRTTRAIIEGDLGRRIEERGSSDELDVLTRNLNAMLARIEELVGAMRQVSDNVAHDLRTPLTRLHNRIEVALMGELGEARSRELLEATLKDADQLLGTFNALLDIAKAESGVAREAFEEVDLGELARDMAELYQPLAEDKGVRFRQEGAGSVRLRAHRHLAAQAIANLLDNAVKYTPRGGLIALALDEGPPVTVTVADTGPGIPPDQREAVLERFVRLDAHRSTPGNGLGLSLVHAVARLHDAGLELADNRPGLRVRLSFPHEPTPA